MLARNNFWLSKGTTEIKVKFLLVEVECQCKYLLPLLS